MSAGYSADVLQELHLENDDEIDGPTLGKAAIQWFVNHSLVSA